MKKDIKPFLFFSIIASLLVGHLANRTALIFEGLTGNLVENINAAIDAIIPALQNNPFMIGTSKTALISGAIGAACVWLIFLYNVFGAKNFMRGSEHGSARWGTAKDIKPLTDREPDMNIPLSATEQISVRKVKDFEADRNKNIVVVGGSGSGKTYVYHMDIYLTTKTWEDYYETNKDTLLEPDQQQQYDALQEVGVYTFRQQLSSPFIGVDWSVGVSSRWGWRIHPISGELKQHLGLDIAMPGGTPINACNAGTIVTGSDASGWGNYIKVVAADGSYTLYGHMSGFAVANGQTVNPGDVIGYVGTTGASTGNHLHLEYHDKDNRNLNPLIFTECEKPTP